MRFSALLLAAAFLPALAVDARRMHHSVAHAQQAGDVAALIAPVAGQVANHECLAECAATTAGCLRVCSKSKHFGCTAQCSVQAQSCSAACSSSSSSTPSVVDASNIDSVFASAGATDNDEMRAAWSKFKEQYSRSYPTLDHEQYRFELFQTNYAKAATLSKSNPTATFGVTQFSDLHPLEFKRLYLGFKPAVSADAALLRRSAPLTNADNIVNAPEGSQPAAFDWRQPKDGRPVGVTAVKDQGQCGSCWAFSATEAVESAWILANKTKVALSPEQTVDCDTVDQGCNGGDTVSAYQYIKKAGGIDTEAAYPYTAGDSGAASTCTFDKKGIAASISGFSYATPGCSGTCASQNESLLKTNLWKAGPVSICVDAEPWQTYMGGIITNDGVGCQSAYGQLDHCVQLVGYGGTGDNAFWTVRNSWGESWGESGHIRLSYGQNTCGVADEATQAII